MAFSIPTLSRGQLMAVVVVLATVLNVITHFTHPAYRYYKEFSQAQAEKFDALEKRIRADFVPAIMSAVSNRSAAVASPFPSFSPSPTSSGGLFPLPSPSPAAPVVYGADVRKDVRLRFSSVDDVPYVTVNDSFHLTVGDDLFGESIRRITPTCLFTDCAVYFYADSPKREQPQIQTKQDIKNDDRKSI